MKRFVGAAKKLLSLAKKNRAKSAGIMLTAGLISFAVISYTQSKASDLRAEYQIELRSDGFYPAELTVPVGSVVRFTTKLGNYFWPASDVHPTHEIYPEFDPKRPIPGDSSWSFRFEKTGTWRYHDHLSPAYVGVITVSTGTQVSAANEPNCAGINGPLPITCRKQEVLAILEKEGLDKALTRIEELYKSDTEFAKGCHGMAHDLGIASYKLYLRNHDSVLDPKASYCASGFYHGFMEALLGATKDISQARSFCLHVKDKLLKDAPDSYLQCFHGIGHGSLEYSLFGRAPSGNEQDLITPALALCEKASQTSEELYRCASGAFNAVANLYITGEYGIKGSKDDPLRFCRIQPEKYKESCYGNMNSYLVWLTKGDLSKALPFVSGLTDGHAPSGVSYLAAMASASNLLQYDRTNLSQALTACRSLSDALAKPCVQGLAQGFLEHGTPATEYLDALKFCELDLLTGAEREICLSFTLGHLNGWYSQEKANRICTEIDESLRRYCARSTT